MRPKPFPVPLHTHRDDYEGYSDEEERVLTREELLAKTNQKISQKQATGQEYGRKGGKSKSKGKR